MKTIDQTMNAATAATDILRSKAGKLGSLVSDESGELRDLAMEKADQARRYLRDRGVSGVGQDLMTVARQHPVAAAATALGLAFFAAKMFRRD
jgi:hypothetical protein